ncbi:hypothetical protein Ancab_013499 [Ancistrocladus abbreviatus]
MTKDLNGEAMSLEDLNEEAMQLEGTEGLVGSLSKAIAGCAGGDEERAKRSTQINDKTWLFDLLVVDESRELEAEEALGFVARPSELKEEIWMGLGKKSSQHKDAGESGIKPLMSKQPSPSDSSRIRKDRISSKSERSLSNNNKQKRKKASQKKGGRKFLGCGLRLDHQHSRKMLGFAVILKLERLSCQFLWSIALVASDSGSPSALFFGFSF